MHAKLKGAGTNKLENAYKGYSHVCGKGEQNAMSLKIYYPHSQQAGKSSTIVVKRESSVEEVIGYALYVYVDEKRLPALTSQDHSVANWNLRIVDDGEVDEDFPALERTRRIQKFSFDQFAICRVPGANDESSLGGSTKLTKQSSAAETGRTQVTQ